MGLIRRLGPVPDGPRPVVLVPQTEHQFEELAPLASRLRDDGIPVDLVVPEPPKRPLNHLRPGVRRHRRALASAKERGWVAGPVIEVEPVVASAGALVVMNDWGVPRDLVVEARRLGIPTAAWVEGVQDFDDVDTGRRRRPYRTADLVMCLGEWDHAQLAGVERVIVGSERLRRLWERPRTMTFQPRAMLNVNFSYGVQVDHRSDWVRGALAAGRLAGIDVVVSRHPADRGIIGRTRESFEPALELLERSSVLVSRFSTLILESLLLGVGVVYHNPHGEAVSTFARPDGAFATSHTVEELAEALRTEAFPPIAVREAAGSFLRHHLRLEGPERPLDLVSNLVTGLRADA